MPVGGAGAGGGSTAGLENVSLAAFGAATLGLGAVLVTRKFTQTNK